MTLVQRFGSALNLNIHFHLLFLDGVYRTEGAAAPVFRQVSLPSAKDLEVFVEQIALRVGRPLEQRGLIERDIEKVWLAADAEAGPGYRAWRTSCRGLPLLNVGDITCPPGEAHGEPDVFRHSTECAATRRTAVEG